MGGKPAHQKEKTVPKVGNEASSSSLVESGQQMRQKARRDAGRRSQSLAMQRSAFPGQRPARPSVVSAARIRRGCCCSPRFRLSGRFFLRVRRLTARRCPLQPPVLRPDPYSHRPLPPSRKAGWVRRRSLLARMLLDFKINPPSVRARGRNEGLQ